MIKFSISNSFSEAHDLTKSYLSPLWKIYGIFTLLFLLFMGGLIGVGIVFSLPDTWVEDHEGLFNLLDFFIGGVITLLFTRAWIKITKKEELTFSSFFTIFSRKKYLNVLLTTLLVTLLSVLGLIVLILPGVFIAVRLQFAIYALLDKNLGPRESVKYSWTITKGHFWRLFGFSFALLGLNILGALCLLVGLYWTGTMSGIALTQYYHFLVAQFEAQQQSLS